MNLPKRSLFHTTGSSLRRGEEPRWQSVADYRRPLELFLGARFPRISAQDREDLVADILLELKEGLYRDYQPDRGRFRMFLCGVVRNRVLAFLKRRRKEHPSDLDFLAETAAPDPGWIRVELLAETFGCIRRWLDVLAAGDDALRRVAVFSRRVVQQESQRRIAEAEKLEEHVVKRWLREARTAIVAELLRRTLELPEEHATGLDFERLARDVLRAFPHSERASHLAEVASPRLRAALLDWMEHLYASLSQASREPLREGGELADGLRMLLEDGPPEPGDPARPL